MSHKIKIDLCELFGVKEGQEFKIKGYIPRYKIENDVLKAFNDNNQDWWRSDIHLNYLKEFEIEILKPETPPEIKKMLQAFYDMGFRCFYKEDHRGICCFDDNKDYWDEEDDCLTLEIRHSEFGAWTKTLQTVSNKTYFIKDYI